MSANCASGIEETGSQIFRDQAGRFAPISPFPHVQVWSNRFWATDFAVPNDELELLNATPIQEENAERLLELDDALRRFPKSILSSRKWLNSSTSEE
jgi:hypothetical protein